MGRLAGAIGTISLTLPPGGSWLALVAMALVAVAAVHYYLRHRRAARHGRMGN